MVIYYQGEWKGNGSGGNYGYGKGGNGGRKFVIERLFEEEF